MAFANIEALIALVRHTLITNTAVSDVVGGRVHGSHFVDPDDRTVVYPLVVIEIDGGGSSTSTYQAVSLQLYTYARTSSGDAMRIYDACYAALQQQLLRRDGVSVAGYSIERVRPDSGWNEVARAWYYRGVWTIRVSHRS